MTVGALIGSVELGMIYAILALGVFLSFRTLNTPDLTVDGSIVTGAAASAMLCTLGVHPVLALVAAFIGGACAGAVTALLNTKLKIQALLAGILVMLGVYSINLRIMGNKANLPLMKSETLYTKAEELFPSQWAKLLVGAIVLVVVIAIFFFFLKTRMGFALRATGDNEEMVRAAGISSDNMKLLGLSVSNGFVGLAGGLLAQYQGYCDIGMGVGMVVIGLASVIIGEVIFGTSNLLRRLIAVALGAIVYRLILAVALNLGMQATDMKLVSAVIVVIALSMGVLGESFSARKKKRGAKNA
ncbi:ABC transporter permease [Anaerovorax odorimutans]|uniref:ABC transporter permease n=1 Tax=Anaerovorax odorimutans TaxID=109327 RepID=A0ABT1RJZ1_9FIRM|nr:ABC transporter permease [Anaerovorax odorimutans]